MSADHLRSRAQAYRDDANGLRRAGGHWTDITVLETVADELTRLATELEHLDPRHPIGTIDGTFAWRCTDPACAITGIGGPNAAIEHYLTTHSPNPNPNHERNHPCLTTTESPASR